MYVKSSNGHPYGFVFVLSSGLRRSRLNWELCFRSQRIPSILLSPTKKSLRRNQRSFRSKFLLAPSVSPNLFLFLSLSFSSLGLQIGMCLFTCLTHSYRHVLYALEGENDIWMIVRSFLAIILRLLSTCKSTEHFESSVQLYLKYGEKG